MKGPLILTPRQYCNPVSVSAQIVDNLQPYHIDGIRYLYQQLFNKANNVILNYESGLNEARQISALLSAVEHSKPSLVFCKPDSISKWYYEFANCSNLKVATVNTFLQESSEIIADHFDAILVSVDQLKHFKTIPIEKWFLFIVDGIDLLMKARYIKTTDAQFRIGITSHNFLLKPDTELQWNILKWINPKFQADKNTFIETENYIKINLLRPYPENWRRLTWFTLGKQKPTDAETLNYDAIVRKWCNINAVAAADTKKCTTRDIKKRSATHNYSKNKPAYKKRFKKEIPPVLTKVKDETNVVHNPQTKQKMTVTDMSDILNIGKTKIYNNTVIKIDANLDTSDEEDKSTHKVILRPTENGRNETNSNNIKIKNYFSFDSEEENPILNSLFFDNEPKDKEKTEENEIHNTDEHISNNKETKYTVNLVDDEENSLLNSLFFNDKIENKDDEINESNKTDNSNKSINNDEYTPAFSSIFLKKTVEQSDDVIDSNVTTKKDSFELIESGKNNSFTTKNNVKEDDSNWILDSILNSPEPATSKKELEKDTEEPCAILDSLFF